MMKYFLINKIVFILVFACVVKANHNYVLAQDSTYSYESILESNNELNKQDNGKFVSQQDYYNALKTIETYGVSYKQRKRLKKQRKKEQQEIDNTPKIDFPKISEDALVRIPVSILSGTEVIEPGFYLIKYTSNNSQGNLSLKQGDLIINNISIDSVKTNDTEISTNQAKTMIIEDNILKLILKVKEKIITAIFPINNN